MDRRSFLGASLAAGALVASTSKSQAKSTNAKFRLKYAPHFGMFKTLGGADPVDQVKFMADQGFTALEDNGMMKKPVEQQKAIAKEMSRQGMTMGVFVAGFGIGNVNFVKNDKTLREGYIKSMKEAVETAKRVNAKWCTVVPGAYEINVEWDYQTANVIENLKYCAEVCEPSGLTMVLESLNHWKNHPPAFLSKIPQAYMICKAVNSPSCKILDDLYHQQIQEGNLIPNMEMAWDEIAYIQVGDNPGRKEPTTGEINYKNIFKYLHDKKYEGVIGMEHGNSIKGAEGEQAVIDAYRYCDSF
jgi:hydroxypyruvate isomerase